MAHTDLETFERSLKIEPFYDTSKPEGDKARSADFSKATTVLGWRPQVSLKEGLNAQYSWIKKQMDKENIII